MNTSDDHSLSPDHAPAPCSSHKASKLKDQSVPATCGESNQPAPRDTALRRRRLQTVRQLKAIADLQEQTKELRAEISSLESIIGAQADAIEALRRQKPNSED